MGDPTTASVLTSVHPVLPARDLEESLAYYRDSLGFAVAWTWGTPAERAGVARDGLELHLLANPALRPAPATLVFHMRGVEAYHRACTAGGARIVDTLEERPWGMRDFRVVDPGGNRLVFGEPIDG